MTPNTSSPAPTTSASPSRTRPCCVTLRAAPPYHQATEDVERIDFPALTRRNQRTFLTAGALANRAALREGNALKCPASGPPALTLEAVSKDLFTFDATGLRLEFDAAKPAFVRKQHGGAFELVKE